MDCCTPPMYGYEKYMRKVDKSQRIIDSVDVENLNDMLEDVVKKGTGKKAKVPFYAAGKTGTSQEFRDAWFVGFSNKFVCAVWLGNDDNSPMIGITGGTLPAEIWKKIMIVAHKNI